MDIAAEFTSAIINALEANKRLADRAVEQLLDDKGRTSRARPPRISDKAYSTRVNGIQRPIASSYPDW